MMEVLATRSPDRARAAHEAGHVVAAKLLGWVTEKATIDGPENCIEELLVAVTEPQRDRRRALRRLRDLQQFMTIVFAGPACEARTGDVPGDDVAAGVIAAAKAELGTLLSDEELEAIIRGAAVASDHIVGHRMTESARVPSLTPFSIDGR